LDKILVEQSAAQYRYWGTELRIVFVLVAVIFLLLAIFNFFYHPIISIIYLVISIIVTVAIRLDHKHHLLSLDEKGITFKKIKWGEIKSQTLTLNWSEVKNIITTRHGLFDTWKKTRIISMQGRTITASSFMEDYFHFLKDIVRLSKNAEINKLTLDLIAGRAEF